MWRSIFVTILVSVCLSGCGSAKPLNKKRVVTSSSIRGVATATSSPISDTANIGEVTVPEYNEMYGILYTEDDTKEVDWGISENGCFFSDLSGLPGFGRPMLIFADEATLKRGSAVTLETAYGSYNYVVMHEYECVANSDLNNVVSKTTREELVQFYDNKEELYVFEVLTGKCFKCGLTGGTAIQL